jgi:hypothetical protein
LKGDRDLDIKTRMSRARIPLIVVAFACAQAAYAPCAFAGPHDALITKHAAAQGVPESLVRRVIQIESRGNARAINSGNFGLMQIRLSTARAMGYRGTAQGLLDADTNMTYAVKYLAGAYRAAGCDESRAVSYYQRGYHGARRAKCSTPKLRPTQIAEARELKSSARPDPHVERAIVTITAKQAAPQSGDVLRPRLVQTQSFSAPQLEPKSESKLERSAPNLAAHSETPPVPAAQTVAAAPSNPRIEIKAAAEPIGTVSEAASPSAPAEITLKDFLTRPIKRSKPAPTPPKAAVPTIEAEPASKPLESDFVGAIGSKAPDAGLPSPASPATEPLAAKLTVTSDQRAVPIPVAKPEIAGVEKDPKPVDASRHHRVRGAKAREPERVTAVQTHGGANPARRVTPVRIARQPAPQADLPERHRP